MCWRLSALVCLVLAARTRSGLLLVIVVPGKGIVKAGRTDGSTEVNKCTASWRMQRKIVEV